MQQGHSFTFVGIPILCTVLGVDLESVRVRRYSALAPGLLPEQADPFALPISMQFSLSIPPVGAARHHVLATSGYRLAPFATSCRSLPTPLAWPLPECIETWALCASQTLPIISRVTRWTSQSLLSCASGASLSIPPAGAWLRTIPAGCCCVISASPRTGLCPRRRTSFYLSPTPFIESNLKHADERSTSWRMGGQAHRAAALHKPAGGRQSPGERYASGK